LRNRLAAVLGLLAVVLGTLFVAAPIATADDPSINVTLVDRSKDDAPVPGVDIAVVNEAGQEVGTATTNADGQASIPIKEGGSVFTTRIDVDTLPEGTTLANPEDVEREVEFYGFDVTVQYPIGPDTRDITTTSERAAQLALSGLKFGLIIALAALGLSMIFGTTGLTNFSHGELVTVGAVVAFALNRTIPLPFDVPGLTYNGHFSLIAAGVITVALMAAFGWGQDVGFWRPLRRRGTGNIALMIISIGVSLLLRYLLLYFFGGDTRPYAQYVDQSSYEVGPLLFAPKDIAIIGIAVVVLVMVSLALSRTRIGKAMRAVSDNPPLAASSGINVSTVIAVVWAGGAALAGLSGVLLGVDQQVEYQTGFKILLLVFAAVTLGGLGTIWGAMLGSVIVGLLVEMSTLFVPTELKYVGAFVALIVILLVRPQGLLGRRERVG
jgi:branched-chain amino acid transport system permease protein